ncbi:hypothetical protein Y1Q_0005434 [Alligator mississippiensis]|uniref:Uncharacterized protein n=1 Tax=Alligator mississippiensis TaxID=8496 RepID=A0A151MZZ5_ALLMI|nr:hypothetical protein Y1Q_0005434 [Alligator mississippiensis]
MRIAGQADQLTTEFIDEHGQVRIAALGRSLAGADIWFFRCQGLKWQQWEIKNENDPRDENWMWLTNATLCRPVPRPPNVILGYNADVWNLTIYRLTWKLDN